MTVTRDNHISEINTLIESYGFKQNSYGIYHLNNYSIDTRKNNIKISKDGFKIVSKVLTKVSIRLLDQWFAVHGFTK